MSIPYANANSNQITSDITIDPESYTKIDLTVKQTSNVKISIDTNATILIIILSNSSFTNWKSQLNYNAIFENSTSSSLSFNLELIYNSSEPFMVLLFVNYNSYFVSISYEVLINTVTSSIPLSYLWGIPILVYPLIRLKNQN